MALIATRSAPVWLLLALTGVALPAGAVADGPAPALVVSETVFGGARAVGNTLMEHDGTTNFALTVGGSEATIPASEIPPDGSIVRAFLFWSGSIDPLTGADRDVDFRLPDGTLYNDLSVDFPSPGEPSSTLNRCVTRLGIGDTPVDYFSCRREVTHLLRALGTGSATGTYAVSDVDASVGTCPPFGSDFFCQARYAGWALVVMWESPTHPVRRDLVLYDAFFAADEQGPPGFSSGLSPEFTLSAFLAGPTADAELTILGFEGDAQLGVPPQNLFPNNSPMFCTTCDDFISLRRPGGVAVRLADANNRDGNLFNGSNNSGGGPHPGLDIDTFDIGPSGLGVLAPNDTQMFLRVGSGDGVSGGGGGGGELVFLGFTLLSLETYSPRFSNTFTEKVVLEPVAGAGETLNYILRIGNDGSAQATQVVVKDQLPAGVSYLPGSTTNTCGVASPDQAGTSPVLRPAGLNVGTLAVNERCEVRFKVTVNAGVADGTVLSNFFTVDAAELDPLRVGPAQTEIQAAELGQPTKRVSVAGGGGAAPGSSLLYRIRVPNTGGRVAPAVRVTDTLPPELSFDSFVSLPPGSTDNSDPGAGVIDVSDISIAANSFAELTFLASVRTSTAGGAVIENQASVTQPSLPGALLTDDPSTSAAVDPTRIVVASGIDLTSSQKSVVDRNGGRAVPGDVLRYTLSVRQSGTVTTTVIVTDDLPPFVEGCSMVSLPAGGFGSCQPGGANGTGRVEVVIPVPAGATRAIVFDVTIQAAAPDGATIVNGATLTPVEEPARALNVTSPAVEVFARPLLLTSRKAAADLNGGDARPGDELRYTINVVNTGPVAASNVIVSDVVPTSLENVVVEDGGSLAGGVVTWTLPSLAPGASAIVRFRADIQAGTPNGTVIVNRAAIAADAPADPFTTPPVSITVRAEPSLVVAQRVIDLNGGAFEPADPVRYEIVVENTGDGAATSVVVREPVDPSLSDVRLVAGGRLLGNDVVFDVTTVPALSSLAPGQTITLTWEADIVTPLANGTVVSQQATLTSPEVGFVLTSDDPTTAAPGDPTRFVVSSQALLRVTKTFVDVDGGALMPGDDVELTLTVSNIGDAPAGAVVVRDPLDTRLAFVSSPDGGQLIGSEVVFTPAAVPRLASLLPGAPVSVRLVVRVASPLANGTVIDNQANATSPDAALALSDDPSTPAPTDPTRLVIESRPVLGGFAKTVIDLDGDGVFEPGDRVRYHLVVENTGSEPAANVIVSDPLPGALENVVVLDGGVLSGGTVRWTPGGNAALASVSVGDTVTLRFEADLERPLADDTLVSNQASLVAAGVSPVLSDDPGTPALDDPTVFSVSSHPRLLVEKTVTDDNGAPVEPGDLLRWTVRVRNTGGRAAVAVVVSDPLPGELVSVTPQDGGQLAGGQLTWSEAGNAALASLGVDQEVLLRFSANVLSPLDNGTFIANQASAAVAESGVPGAPWRSDDPATPAPMDPTRVQVVSASDLTASTLESFDESGVVISTRRPGELIDYQLVVRNVGREIARNVDVSIPIPVELTVESSPGGALSAGVLRYTAASLPGLGEVAPGEELRVSFEARVAFPLDDGTELLLQAQLDEDGLVAAVPSDDPSSPALGDATRVVVQSAADLSGLQKRFSDSDGAPVEPGDEIVYFIDVVNSGDANARNVVVTDPLPADVEFVGSVTGGRLVGGAVVFDASSTPALLSLPPGSVELAFTVRVRDDVGAGTIVSNQASAAAEGLSAVPSDDPSTPDTDDDPTRFPVVTVPRVELDKTLITSTGTRIVAPGEPLTYVFVLRSTGTAATGALSFEDVVPAGLSNVAPGPGLSFDVSTRRLTAQVASMAPLAEVTLRFSALVAAGTPNGTRLENQARVRNDDVAEVLSDDPDTAAETDPTVALVEATPNLSSSTKAVLDVDGAPLLPGDLLRYTITVVNSGNGAARDVVLRDPLDTQSLELVSASNGGRLVGDDVLWDGSTTPALVSVAAGASITLRVDARVRAGTEDGTSIANQGALSARDVAGPVLTDDPSTPAADDATVVVVRAPVLTFEKTLVDLSGGAPLRPGDQLRYELTVRNQGSAAASDLRLSDVAPAALVDVAPLNGGVLAGGVVTWAAPAVPGLGTLAPGAALTVALTARVDPLTSGGTVLSNQAELVSTELGAPLLSDDPTTAAPLDPTRRVVEADETYAGTVTLFDADTDLPIVAPVVPGQRVRARVSFTSTGTQTGRGGVLRVPYNPLRFVLEEASAFGIIDQDADEARWDASLNDAFRDLSPGEAFDVEVIGRVVSPIPDGAVIEVRADLDTLSSGETHTFGPARMVVASRPDLGASTKEVIDENGGLVEPGDVLRYRITVVNDGGAQAADVLVIDPPPAGTVYLPGSATVAGVPVPDAGGSPFVAGLPIGDVDAGRSVVVTFQVRVDLHALRGFVIANQAVLRAGGASDAMTDNPRTPLIPGDATVVVVGGGPTLLVSKRGAPSPARAGGALRFEIAIENAGNDLAQSVLLRDVLPASVDYIEGSATLDGTPLSDAADADGFRAGTTAAGKELELSRDVLEAGEGLVLAFSVTVSDTPVVVNQAEVAGSGIPLTLSDGEPSVPGAQATVIPVQGSAALLVDEGTTTLSDANGGLLEAGDPILGRTVIHNRSLVPIEVGGLSINLSALFTLDTGALDARLGFDPQTRMIGLVGGPSPRLAPGESLSFEFSGTVNDQAQDGDAVRASASVAVEAVDGEIAAVDLGTASLTVGLLAGTGALAGILYVDNEERDGVLDLDRDVRATGFSVMAFPVGSQGDDPVRTAISDEGGRFRLSPLPAGDWRLEIRSPSGALFSEQTITALRDGELREQDLRIEPSGSVYGSGDFTPVRGARLYLYVDDADGDVTNDRLVPEAELGRGQQGQLSTVQGLYRFDAPAGDYRLGVEPPSALLVFPSTRLEPVSRQSSHPLGAVADTDSSGTVVAHALPDEALDRSYFLRFRQPEPGWRALNNHIPIDRLQDRVRITKTANRRRLSVGDLVAYTVRVENRSAAALPLADGGVELVDTLPEAFRLVDGSWRLDRLQIDASGQQRRFAVDSAQVEGKSVLRFGPFAFAPDTVYELRYQVVVGPGAPRGDADNRALLRTAAGQVPLSDVATARVRVEADPLFDLGSVRAKIYCDDDDDGWQDPGERGVVGARVYLDTGHYAESDISGKLHFTLVPPGMHLAKLDVATLPPGTRMRGDERQSVYLSAGLPTQVSFTTRCVTDLIDTPEIVLNADAFKPLAPPAQPLRTVKVEALLSSPRVRLDGVEMAVPVVDLGVGVEGAEPAFGRAPGPNLPPLTTSGALAQRLVFVPNVEAPRALLGWQLTLQKEAPQSAPVPVYVFSGEGALPEKLAWDGRDKDGGALLLEEGARYGAVLAVVLEGGDEGMSAVRPFGVAFGEAPAGASEAFEVKLDAADGPLFTAAGKPTRKLREWTRSHAPRFVEQPGPVHIHVHVDARPKEAAQALTAKQAQAVADLLEKEGVPRGRITAVGEGDTKPLRPNLRERDRRKNRRVELRLATAPSAYAALPPRDWPASVQVGGAAVDVAEGALSAEHSVDVAIGDVLVVDVTVPSGGRARIARRVPEGPFDPAGVPLAGDARSAHVSGDLSGGALRFGDRELPLDVLSTSLTSPVRTSDGALRIARTAGERVDASFSPVGLPAERAWSAWRLRVMERQGPVEDPAGGEDAGVPGPPASSDGGGAFAEGSDAGVSDAGDGSVHESVDDTVAVGATSEGSGVRRRVVRELSGEGAPPASIAWDGKDADGKLVAAPGTEFYVRLIVETKAGDVVVSPDVVARVEEGAAPVSAAGPAQQRQVVSDALEKDGGLSKSAVDEIKAAAAKLAAISGALRITVHTDDEDGPRFSRRARTQRGAEEAKALLVAAGVEEQRITAIGLGSDEPRVPNLSSRARRSNRRVEIELLAPAADARTRFVGSPRVLANGRELPVEDGKFSGEVPATRSGEVSLMIRTAEGARVMLKLRPEVGEPWQGTPEALEQRALAQGMEVTEPAAPLTPQSADAGVSVDDDAGIDSDGGELDREGDAGELVSDGDAGAPAVAELAPLVPWTGADGEAPPDWWPRLDQVPASVLEVELPPDGEAFRTNKLVVRGKTAPGNRVRVGGEEVLVDPDTGAFEHLVTLQPGDGELVVESVDGMGNKARVRRQVSVDKSGWFMLLLADTAFGGDGALLDERTPYTSLKLGDTFLYGRGVAYLKGRWASGYLFKDYELTLHLDTGRWEEEAWARDLLNPDLVYPVFGDGSVEVQDANARFPLYFELKADTSSLRVGNVRPTLQGGDLFRYSRARYGASLELDRGWSYGLDVSDVVGAPPAPGADPWRTRAGAFFTGGDTRERHARVELMGTGGAVYFLRHELLVEGSERAAIIIRDAVTGAEIGRRPLARNIDYTMRYSEGRIFLMEPLSAFTDAAFLVNHNLGQVSGGHRLFLEVEYDHQDAEPFMGLAGGGHATQTLFGHLELGGGYVHEGREDGAPGYQLGGVHAKLFYDDVTWLKAEWAWSKNVDAGNFLSLDGGLSYSSLGQAVDETPHRFGRVVFPAEREGQGYKLEGQLGFGQWLGRSSRDGLVHAYFQRLTPGFFAGASIVEQGQTKWGTDGAWRITDDDTLRLRYDGVISEIPEIPHVVSETRQLHRQLATAQYQRRILPSLTGAVEYGYGYTHDSGSFGDSSFAQPRDFHTNVGALALDWQALERLTLGIKQEAILTGDPAQLLAWNDHLVTHAHVRYSLTDDLALTLSESVRWSGENQTSAGVAWRVNEEARVYANERFGFAQGGFTNSTVVGGETLIAENTRAYAEYQLQSAFSSDQTRGVVGISNRWKLPFGLALNLGYERVQTFGGVVNPTETGNVPPGAFTDGTFYAAPGANEGGSWFYGAGSRDAASAGIDWVRKGLFVGSQRFELRYDNFDESRGGHDRVWLLNMSNAELRLSPEVALMARLNIGLAQDLTLQRREAYLEESLLGVSFRPVTHDWVSVLAKLSRRVDNRPISLQDGRFEDYTIHAAAVEPIVELPWKLQLVEKLAIKHVSQILDDLPRADAWTLLWINRVNWHALGTFRALGVDPLIPGEIDLGVEYRVLAGITAARLEHGALFEVQYAPVSYFRLGVGYNFTRFSDYELARDDRDYSGFFVRGVGQF